MEKETVKIKKLVILIILMLTVISCSYFEGAEKERRERGWECMYTYKGELQGCNYIK